RQRPSAPTACAGSGRSGARVGAGSGECTGWTRRSARSPRTARPCPRGSAGAGWPGRPWAGRTSGRRAAGSLAHESRWCDVARRPGEHLVAGLGDQHRVLPLRRERAVARDDGPAVAHFLDLAPTGVDHGLDGEGRAGLELFERARAAVVQHLRVFVEALADAVAAELAHHAEAVAFG